MESKIISDSESFASFKTSLATVGLPPEDLQLDSHLLVGYYENENLIGTGGLEIYGRYGLLRSVSLIKPHQGKKLGTLIVRHLIDQARIHNLQGVYLLTETAREFFRKMGFEIIDRGHVVAEVKASVEFVHVCPSTAVCMYLDLV